MSFEERRAIIVPWSQKYQQGLLTFEDHQEAYTQLWNTGLPEQSCYDEITAIETSIWDGANVCEVGGWDGQLAKHVLAAHPAIHRWVNFEICKEAAEVSSRSVRDKRYTACAYQWVWDADLARFNTLVSSHCIEHMTLAHLRKMLEATSHMKSAFIQVPDDMRKNVGSTHILGISVDELVSEFLHAGWQLRSRVAGPAKNGPDTVMVFFQ